MVLDLLTGGDLRYQIGHHKRQYFSEIQTKFFVSCIISALYYIHNNNIIHRDIKPENLVFDRKGYLHITDFGIAKFKNKNNKNETSGTPGYMAPEVMKGMNHTGSVDYFAVGVITYELMMGKRPYVGKNRKEIKEQMMSKQIYIDPESIQTDWSKESIDFINKLLIRKDIKRLGFYNELEIQNHPWLYDIDFDKIVKKELISPFIPKLNQDNYDKKYCEEIEKIGFETNYRYEEYKANNHYREIFLGFTFYNIDDTKFKIYKKPTIKYIQNKKYKITENLKTKKSQTLNTYTTKNNLSFNKGNTINCEYIFKDNDTIEVDKNYNIPKGIKKLYSNSQNKDRGNYLNNYSNSKHKRIKSNLVGHNFLFFLQKKKLFYLNDTQKNFNNNSSNNDESNLVNTMKFKNNCTINYHKSKNKEEKKVFHEHANSFTNNLYMNLLNKIRKEKSGTDEFMDKNLFENKPNIDKKNKKRTIELIKVPKSLKIDNNNNKCRNLNYLKKMLNKPLSLENIDSTLNSDKKHYNEIINKTNILNIHSNFNMKQKIPHILLNKLITPNNLKNKKNFLNTNYNNNNKLSSINNDKTIENSPRKSHLKIKTKSFSKNSYIDNSNHYQNILNMISSEEQSLEKKYSNKKENENNNIYSKANQREIRHNYSYSSFNNKNKIEYMINNIFKSEKNKKTPIPMIIKKSSNTLVNPSKVSKFHKKIPIPITFGKKIFRKRIGGFEENKMTTPLDSNLSITNNNSISNSSLSKQFIFNQTNSSGKNLRKDEFKTYRANLIISPYINNNNAYSTINSKKKNMINLALNSKNSNNLTSLIKKLSNYPIVHKKNLTIGNQIVFSKGRKKNIEKNIKLNRIEKLNIRNKVLKGQIKKIGNTKIRKKFNEDLMNVKMKEQNEDYNKINNIVLSKKISNCNSKNKINSNNKSIKSSNIASFSYHSYNSTTSSGCKINNK